MNWRIDLSKDALKFLNQNNFEENFITDKIKLALEKFQGKNINIDIKKLKGKWEGFFRIRFGKLRIIVEFKFEYCRAYIDKIDYRGNIYK